MSEGSGVRTFRRLAPSWLAIVVAHLQPARRQPKNRRRGGGGIAPVTEPNRRRTAESNHRPRGRQKPARSDPAMKLGHFILLVGAISLVIGLGVPGIAPKAGAETRQPRRRLWPVMGYSWAFLTRGETPRERSGARRAQPQLSEIQCLPHRLPPRPPRLTDATLHGCLTALRGCLFRVGCGR